MPHPRLRTAALALALGAATVVVLVPATPASAGVVTTSAGTVVSVDVTGDETVDFGGAAGVVQVNAVTVAPSVACSALTLVAVTGDAGQQVVNGDDLDAPAFSAGPSLTAALEAGQDLVRETARADSLDLGSGDDGVVLQVAGPDNDLVALGADDGHTVVLIATDGDESIVASGDASTETLVVSGASTATRTYTGADVLSLGGGAGNDDLDIRGVADASFAILEGGAGNDVVRSGDTVASIEGGGGTNQLEGGSGQQYYFPGSQTDVLVDVDDGEPDIVSGGSGRRSGGLSLSGFGPEDAFSTAWASTDGFARVRANGTGAPRITLSLDRTGQQDAVGPFGAVTIAAPRPPSPDTPSRTWSPARATSPPAFPRAAASST